MKITDVTDVASNRGTTLISGLRQIGLKHKIEDVEAQINLLKSA